MTLVIKTGLWWCCAGNTFGSHLIVGSSVYKQRLCNPSNNNWWNRPGRNTPSGICSNMCSYCSFPTVLGGAIRTTTTKPGVWYFPETCRHKSRVTVRQYDVSKPFPYPLSFLRISTVISDTGACSATLAVVHWGSAMHSAHTNDLGCFSGFI